jgi:pimeloyl-ACP methyl ester carboxylesterase
MKTITRPVTEVRLTLEIRLAEPLPPTERVYIAGNLPALGNWKPDKVRVRERPGKPGAPKTAERVFEFSFFAPKGTVVELKLTRGRWKTQAVYAGDDEPYPPNNRVIKADKEKRVVIKVTDWFDRIAVTVDPVMGDLRTISEFPAPGLNYPRDLYVWFPPGYFTGKKRYPVLYMHDGQNLFDPGLSFCGNDWKVDETATRMIRAKKLREFMVVGISNSPDRMEEYNLGKPLGRAYAAFLLEHVKPFIDETFRTLPGPENTAIMGSSMGGLISFQLGWHFPETFGMAGCLSSSFQFCRTRLFRDVAQDPHPVRPVKFYLDTGELEPPIVSVFHRMRDLLLERGYTEDENLLAYFDQGATHSEAAWANRLHVPLTWFFGTKSAPARSRRRP